MIRILEKICIMNHIIINKLSDLQNVLGESIYISGHQSLVEEETYNNMWALTFGDKLIKELEVEDLEKFLSELLKKRRLQLASIDAKAIATFYLWFDEQALQLRFNFISGENVVLPFGCKVNLLNSPEPIFNDLITTIRQVTIEGDVVEFFDPSKDFDDEIEEEYVLDLYVKVLG